MLHAKRMHPSTIFETFLLIDHKHTSQCLSGENGASIELSFGGMRVPISVKTLPGGLGTFGITFVMPRVESWYSAKATLCSGNACTDYWFNYDGKGGDIE